MEHDHILAGLKRKRAETAGEINRASGRLAQLRGDLEALDRAILIFDPAADPGAIRPVTKRKRKPDQFMRGELTRAVLAVMRAADAPVSVRDISNTLSAEHGVGKGGNHDFNSLMTRVATVLRKHEGRTVANDGTRGMASLWRLV